MRERKNRWREEKKKGNETFLHDLRRIGGPNASGQEKKLVHVTRVTCGYRNPNFWSKLQEVGVFSYTGSSLFMTRKWPCGSTQTRDLICRHWDYFSDSPGLGFEGRYSSRFWFRDNWKCRHFCCELFFGTVFGPSFRIA